MSEVVNVIRSRSDNREHVIDLVIEHVIVTSSFVHLFLCLCSNRITRDGAKQLAELLKCDTMLSVLDLGFNRIGDDGATAIADALALRNRTLKA